MTPTQRRRLDRELVRRKIAPSRAVAQQLIADGAITVGGAIAQNAARQVHVGDAIEVRSQGPRFVGRGGEKLAGALDAFALDVTGLRVLDVGASTGGFTDCVLQRGAQEVFAIDVGTNQLHEKLRRDRRVHSKEQTHIRDVVLTDCGGEPLDLAVIDVSFTSCVPIIAHVRDLVADNANVIVLVKPQFEAGRAIVSKGKGVVRDDAVHQDVLTKIRDAAQAAGYGVVRVAESVLKGAEGNTEFFMWLRRER